MAGESLSPGDLVLEVYERLGPEDQLALKGTLAARQAGQPTRHGAINHLRNGLPSYPSTPSTHAGNIIGPDFDITVPTVPNGNPFVRAFSLPNPEKGQLLDLTWDTFGYGIERLMRQIPTSKSAALTNWPEPGS